MSRYNHFAIDNRERVKFSDLEIGDKFRCDFKGFRRNIVCVKTGLLSKKELRSGKEYTSVSDQFTVYKY